MVEQTAGKQVASHVDATRRNHEIGEDWYRKAFQLTPDALNINRLDDGRYVSINQGFTKITGFSEADVRGKTSLEIDVWVNPEDRRRLVQALLSDGQVLNFEAKFRTKAGAILDGIMSAAVIQLGNAAHIISITRDISDHKLLKIKRQLSDEKYLSLANDLPVFIVTFSRDGTLTFANNAIAKLVGMTPSQLTGMVFFDFLNAFDRQLVQARLAQLLLRPCEV
jgi:PAS domain S-box-containing protein